VQEPILDLGLCGQRDERLKHVERVQDIDLCQAWIWRRVGPADLDSGDAHARHGEAEWIAHLWQAEARRNNLSDGCGELDNRLNERQGLGCAPTAQCSHRVTLVASPRAVLIS
jgi:hypothetical protein